ncbi:MAG TPA: hypothetical protein VLE27_05230 [Thermoanaerobaculia bacterium]|nr:hypothetical protein [Thermoanaerobaculia bacterium]
MKKLTLLAALALVALALPVSAGPTLIQYCSVVNGTSCTTVGAKKSCTDVCGNNLSCTCTYYYSNPSVKFWYCQQEC